MDSDSFVLAMQLVVLYVPGVQELFHVQSPDVIDWTVAALFAAIIFSVIETGKYITSKIKKPPFKRKLNCTTAFAPEISGLHIFNWVHRFGYFPSAPRKVFKQVAKTCEAFEDSKCMYSQLGINYHSLFSCDTILQKPILLSLNDQSRAKRKK